MPYIYNHEIKALQLMTINGEKKLHTLSYTLIHKNKHIIPRQKCQLSSVSEVMKVNHGRCFRCKQNI